MRNNNSTLSEKTKITVGLLIAILLGLAGFGTVVYQAASALPRDEAYQKFVPQDQYQRDMQVVNQKLDRLIELMMERNRK